MLCSILEKNNKKKHLYLFEGVNKDYREDKIWAETRRTQCFSAENNLRRGSEYAEVKRQDRVIIFTRLKRFPTQGL